MVKILVVEDDKFLNYAYQSKLPKEGFEIDLAVDGEMALEKIESFRPDLVILDIMIPKINGLEVLEKMRKDKKTKKIPVIITSNLNQDYDIKKCMKLGANGYLIKSEVSINEVVDKIRKVLKQNK